MAALAATTLGSCATQKNHQKTDNSMNATKIESNLDEQYLVLSGAEQKAVAQTNDFAFNLFRTQEGMDSKVLSPISVAYLMGMLANGAEGATQTEIMKALGQDGTSLQTLNDAYKSIINHASALDRRTQINIANCIAVNKQVTFKNEYATAMKALFEAQVESMDFTSPKTLSKINGWCAKQTDGMIPNIVDQLDANATAVLMNAIYFNGTWASKFDKSQTAQKELRATAERLFRAELTGVGITGKRADAIIRATDLTAIKVKDGALEDAKAVQDGIRTDWAEFIPKTETKGAQVDNPPANNGQSAEPKSLAEAMRMRYEKGS